MAGERRLAACKLLGWQKIEVREVRLEDYLDRLKAERDENTTRKDFTFSEMVDLGKKIEAVEAERAKVNSLNQLKQFNEQEMVRVVLENTSETDVEVLPPRKMMKKSITKSKDRTRDKIARRIGIGSGRYYQMAKFIAEHADFEMIRLLDEKQISINGAYLQLKARAESAEAEKARLEQELRVKVEEARQSKGKAAEIEDELLATNRKLADLKARADEMQEAARTEARNEIARLEKQLQKLSDAKKCSDVEIVRMADQITELNARLRAVKEGREEKATQSDSALLSQLEATKTALAQKESEMQQLRDEFKKQYGMDIEDAKGELQRINAEIRVLQAEINRKKPAILFADKIRKITLMAEKEEAEIAVLAGQVDLQHYFSETQRWLSVFERLSNYIRRAVYGDKVIDISQRR